MKLGIIGAMREEIEPIAALLEQPIRQNRHGRSYVTGSIGGCPAVITRSGIGKVNAAIATQAMISSFEVDRVINMGSSGGIAVEVEIGDLVIATDAIEYDVDLSPFGLVPGEVMYKLNLQTNAYDSQRSFPTDPHMAQLALTGAQTQRMTPINGRTPQIHQGRVVSGDAFLSNTDKKRWLRDTFQPLAADMEAAAIAHVCEISSVPILIVRAISDQAETHANINFQEFVIEATRNYAGIIRYVAQQLIKP